MSKPEKPEKQPPADPALRRGVSRRDLITDELGKASLEALKRLPSLSPLLGFALREGTAQRDRRLVSHLWQLLMGREPKPEERGASMEGIRNARTPEEKGDALVDVVWALTQTHEFEALQRPDPVLVRGLYRIALDRDPTEEERAAALTILAEAAEPVAKSAALEGLFTGLIRSMNSVLRKDPMPGR
jgi:hypothetical protein